MGRAISVQACERAVQDLLGELPRPEQKALASVTCGVVHAQSVCLGKAAASSPGPAKDPSKERRAQRLLANPRFDVARAQRRLIARVTRGAGRVDLLLDATITGASAHYPGVVSLVFALARDRRAVPLVWRTWEVGVPPQDWAGAIRAMIATLRAALPPTCQVVVMADRGLTGAPLARAVLGAGWHLCWRVQRPSRVRLPDGRVVPVGDLAPAPGSQRMLTGCRVYAPQRHDAPPRWDQALPLQVVAVWRAGDPEPWLLFTDLPASRARCREYRRRTWEEELFRDLKSMGWAWQRSRVRRPERVDRLLFILALATLWMLALGERVVRRGLRTLLEAPSRRRYSLFALGLRYAQRLLAADRHVPCYLTFLARPTPP